MGSTGTPLGLGLAIDFAALDADLSRVADRIEQTGRDASLKVGTLAGMAAKGGNAGDGGDALAGQVAQIGVSLSQGVASGVRTSSALMLSFAARINAMLDRLAGSAITMFSRIDAAMKFPRWNTLITSMRMDLSHFAGGGTKAMSDLDRAMGGGFGKIAQTAARVLKPLFDNLGKSIGAPIQEAIAGIGPMMATEMGRVVSAVEAAANKIKFALTNAIEEIAVRMKGLRVSAGSAGEASADAFMAGFRRTGNYVSQFGERQKKAAPTETRVAKYFGSLQPGQRDELLAKPPPPATFAAARPAPQMFKGYVETLRNIAEVGKQAAAVIVDMGRAAAASPVAQLAKQSAILFGQATLQIVRFGAGVAEAFLGIGQKIYQLRNFMSSLGSVSSKTFTELYSSHGLFVGSLLGSIKLVRMLAVGLVDLATLRAFRRVGADAQAAGTSIKTTTGLVGRLTSSVGRLGFELMAAFGVIGVVYKLVDFFKQGTKNAAELNETVNVSRGIFGDAFGPLSSQADNLSKKYGVLRNETLQVSAGFGAMAQGAGMTESASGKLAEQLTTMTIDFARTWQLPFLEAAEKVRSGLGGQGRALKEYGVFIDDDAVKARALAAGLGTLEASAQRSHRALSAHVKISKSASGMPTVDKVGKAPKSGGGGGTGKLHVDLARSAEVASRADIIMKGLGYTMGALERTSGGASAQFKKAGGGVGEFATRIGEILLPSVTLASEAFNTLLATVLDFTETNIDRIQSWAGTVKGWMENVGMVVRNSGSFWQIAQLRAGEFVINTVAYLKTLPENLAIIWPWIKKNWLALLEDLLNGMKVFATNLLTNAMNLGKALWEALQTGEFNFTWTPLLKGFERVTEQLPELIKPALVSVQSEIDKITDEIGRKEAAIPKITQGPMPKRPGPVDENAGTKHEYKLASTVEIGSKEASSIIARSLSPGARVGDPAKEAVRVAKDQHATLKQIATNTAQQKRADEFHLATR